ncbi:MAG: hypothetical protein N2508_05010 [Anaerolineae bacterium]|nr:hypothetical protein [Anaerolineae bacterium]
MSNRQMPKSEHLFLLVGTNPLPNYVAGKLLLKPDGYIYLVHTDETAQIAERLIAVLRVTADRVTMIEVKEAQGDDIFEKVEKYARDKQDVGLHYTGGTKAMAVHAYRAVERHCPEAVFSYLDARTLSIVVDLKQQTSQSFPVSFEVQPTVDNLLELHGHTLKKRPLDEPFKPNVAQALANSDCAKWRRWCDQNLRSGSDTPIREEEDYLAGIALPSLIDWQGAQTLKDLATQWGKKVKEVAEWLDGKWLEHYTLWSLQQVASSCSIHEAAMSVITKERKFEFDVVAMRGYQLFAISCSTEARKGKLKLKLFEAYVRARQMGGDEARVGLVCCAPKNNPDSNPAAIQREIEESWDAAGRVRVFGVQHLSKLSCYLQDWFDSQPS